ncbi:MAG TPA: mevalonate kinase [Nitrosopumilaceae archaeon]|nr:mevalonate kinase [Nitrosopumilaceae archaeon]
MKSVASAPGKVILFGEHFVVYGIKAILCSIDRRITATSQIIDEKKIKIKSDIGNMEINTDSLSKPDRSMDVMKPFLYIAKKALEKSGKNVGIEIKIDSEIPAGIGLGSSSACCVAVAASVMGLFEKLPKEEILKIAIEAERTIFENTSGADCSVCTFGGLMEYDMKNGFKKINSNANFDLVIANSKQAHFTSEIVENVRRFRENNEDLFASFCDQESILIQNALVHLEKKDLESLGLLMSKNQDLLERINISTEKLALLVREAKKTSFGAKITGAGGGGCVIALVDKSNLEKTLSNLKTHSECFSAKIDFNGLVCT